MTSMSDSQCMSALCAHSRTGAVTGHEKRNMRGSFFLTLLAVSISVACNAGASFADAEAASQVLHLRIEQAQYGTIYEGAAQALRGGVSETDFVHLMEVMARDSGPCSGSHLESKNATFTPSGALIQLTYRRRCQNRDLIESLTWVDVARQFALYEFHATPVSHN